MATLRVKQLRFSDFEVVALRTSDVAECEAAGLTPEEAVRTSVNLSAAAWLVSYNDQPLAYWGHAPVSVLGNVGVAWCLSCPAADQHPVLFARASIDHVDILMSLYAEVFIQVDLNYKTARRWLRWLGFEEINRSGRFATMRKVR